MLGVHCGRDRRLRARSHHHGPARARPCGSIIYTSWREPATAERVQLGLPAYRRLLGRSRSRAARSSRSAMTAWCVKQEWIATNPAANVEPIGQRNRGKKQLRIDEARKLVDVCIRRANEGDEAAVGALTSFLLGLRASEVTDRVVRDLDDNGRLLWIEFGKTKRSRRTLEVPALLRPYLLALAKDRPADAQLISRTIFERTGKKRDRHWLLYHVERLCAEAEVPVVCTQSLRGLHASVATDAGATSHVVASALGHSSPAVTHAHYIDGATARRACGVWSGRWHRIRRCAWSVKIRPERRQRELRRRASGPGGRPAGPARRLRCAWWRAARRSRSRPAKRCTWWRASDDRRWETEHRS
jgi:integrase